MSKIALGSPGDPVTGLSRRAYLQSCCGLAASVAGCLSDSTNVNSGPDPAQSTVNRTSESTDANRPFEFPPDHCVPSEEPSGSGRLSVPFDSRGRFRCGGVLLDGMEELSHWSTLDGHLSADSERYFGGGQSAVLETDGSTNRAWISREFDPGLDLSAHDLSVAVHPGGGATKAEMLRVQVLAPDYQNRVDMRHGVGKLGGWFRMDLGPSVIKGEPDLRNVREIRLQSLKGGDRSLRLNVDELRIVPKADRGRVMITFDDIPRSQYSEAFPVMQEFGFPGVAGAIPWLTENPSYISKAGLGEMQEAGWDIVSHPQVTDPSTPLPELDRERQRAVIEQSKRWLLDNDFERGARFVIWPFHAADSTTLELAARYHSLGFAGGRPPSGIPPTDPLTIGRVDGDGVSDTLKMLEFAEEYRQLCVIMYHQIGSDGLPTDEFERTLRAIEQSSLEVITASDLWELMTR